MRRVPAPTSRRRDLELLTAYAAEPTPARLEQLVERYRPLSRSLASRYRGGNEPFEDLVQVADMGLVKAIKGFDPERPNSFTSYAVPTILGELRRHFRDRVWNLRLPRALQESTMTVDAAVDRLTERLGRVPKVTEVAAETGLEADAVVESLVARDARWTKSMEAPVSTDDGAATRGELIGTVEPGYDKVEADYACATAQLKSNEREMLRLRFNEGMSQSDIGDRMGVSQMQVSRVSRRGLHKLLTAVQGDEASPIAA